MRLAFLFAALMALLLVATPARAHWADLAAADVLLGPDRAEVTLTVPTGLLAFADDDRDQRLSAAEVRAHADALTSRLGEAVVLTSREAGPATLEVAPSDAAPDAAMLTQGQVHHSSLALTYRFPAPVDEIRMRYALFVPGVSTARCVATVSQGTTSRSVVFTPDRPEATLAARPWHQTAAEFVRLGVEHIVLGYDHVLFLIALLLMGGGLGYLLKIVTAFTVAHSLTLTLAALNLVALPPRLVESLIALSIVYVAAENFWRRDLKGRWLLTLGFGLVHGLGFASVLKEIGLPAANMAAALVSFNVGVELGQIAIVAVAYGALRLIRKQPWELALRRVASAGVVAMGVFWFVERAILGA